VDLGEDVLALLRKPSLGFLATLMADGSPQVTEVWVDTDGEHVRVNSVQTHRKVTNIARDPRVAIAIADPDEPFRFAQVRGRVIAVTTEGGDEHIEQLAQRYLGEPYPWYGGRDQVRVIITIAPEHVTRPLERSASTT
jgi:PPOX class probable F420-dependent enzyme